MQFRIPVALVGVAAVVVVAGGCSTAECETDADCRNGLSCHIESATCVKAEATRFSLSLTPAETSVAQRGSVDVEVKLEPVGEFAEPVTIGISGAPSGVTSAPLTLSRAEPTGTLTLSASASAATGAASFDIRGTAGDEVQSARLKLTVTSDAEVVVEIQSPAADMSTNGTVTFEVSVTGIEPSTVELALDGAVLTTLQAPYSYAWDSTSTPEGEHTFVARALLGARTYASVARVVTVDRTAPVIVTRTPSVGALKVDVNAPIKATFSEKIDPASIEGGNVSLFSGSTAVAKNVSLSADGMTITIAPDARPVAPANYSVIFSGVKDLAGNALQNEAQLWSFSYPSWLPLGPPISGVAGATKAERPHLRISPGGNAFVAWIESDGASKNVYVARWDGASWQQSGGALSAYATSGTNAVDVSLTIDAAGNPVVAWIEQNGARTLFCARWSNGAWSYVGGVAPANGTEYSPTTVDLALDASGNPMLLSAGVHELVMSVFGFRWTGSAWVTLPMLTTAGTATTAYYPTGGAIRTTATGVTYAAMAAGRIDGTLPDGSNSMPDGILVAKWTGSAWTRVGEELVTPNGNRTAAPTLGFDQSGNPIAGWLGGASAAENVYAARWSGTQWVHLGMANAPGTTATEPSLDVSSSGTIGMAFVSPPSSDQRIALALSGGSWTRPTMPLATDENAETAARAPSLTFGPGGLTAVAFEEGSPTSGDVFAFRRNE